MFQRDLGLSKRTAQRDVKERTPRYLAWEARTRATFGAHEEHARTEVVERRIEPVASLIEETEPSESLPESIPLGPPAANKLPSDRTANEHAEVVAWGMYLSNARASEKAARARDDLLAAGFARTALEAFKGYLLAKQARERDDLHRGNTLPASEYEALCMDVMKLTQIQQGMMADLAARIDPTNPHRLLVIFERWVEEKINPATRAFIERTGLAA